MSTMTPLVEYLLAVERPEGGHVTRYGGATTTVPIFPQGLSISYELRPWFGSYASIEFYHRFSPSMVPGAFTFDSISSGVQIISGAIGTIHTMEGNNTWVVITDNDPIITTITNISGVNQFFETGDAFLLIDSESDFDFVKQVIQNWGAFEPMQKQLSDMVREQQYTNDLLRALANGTPAPPRRG